MSDLIISKEDLIKKGSETGLDLRVILQWVVGLTILGAGAYFLLPILVTIAWSFVNLCVAGGIIFLFFVAFKWIKRWGATINRLITRYTLGLVCEWDEFGIQEQQIDKAEHDVEDMLDEKAKIEGEYAKLNDKILKNQKEFEINTKTAQVASRNGDPEAADDATLAAQRNQNYVETIGPIADDMKFIIDFVATIQKDLKRKIKNAKADLQQNKDIYSSAQSGARALNSAKKAIVGDVQLNSDAEFAKERIRNKIALSIGQMRTSMEVLSQVSKEDTYRDKAKMEIAKQRLQSINAITIDGQPVGQLQYQTSQTFSGIQQPKKFGDLL